MGDISIYNSIRNSKVNTGNVWQYQGMRTFDDSAQVCPARANVSDSGVVGVARDSIQSYAPGCFSALDRMTVENIQRPHYSTYLNASAINDPGVGDDAMSATDYAYGSSQPYDTMFGNTTTTRPVLPKDQLAPTYRAANMQGGQNAQEREANYIRCAVNSVYDQHGCDASATGRGGQMNMLSRQGYSSGGYGGYPTAQN